MADEKSSNQARLENIREHLEEAGSLTRESFDHATVSRDNLEDFRIHINASMIQMYEILRDLVASQQNPDQ